MTSSNQCGNCYPDGEGLKRHPLPPVCGHSVTRSIGYCKRCGAVQSLKLIGLPIAGQFCIHALLLSALYLVTGMTHNTEA